MNGIKTRKSLPSNRSDGNYNISGKLFTVNGKTAIDALGLCNIQVRVNEKVGETNFVGLKFKNDVLINIWKDGLIETDREGIVANDIYGVEWISKKVNIDGRQAIIMVRKR